MTVLPVADGFAVTTGPELLGNLSTLAGSETVAGILSLSALFWVFAAYRFVAVFLPSSWKEPVNPLGWSASLGRFAVSAMLVVSIVYPMLVWGNNSAWYEALPLTAWILLVLGTALNLFAFLGLVNSLNNANPVFRQYQEFVRLGKNNAATAASPVFKSLRGLLRIRAKLLFSFISIIAIILLILSSILLSNYEKTILQAVGDGARSQVEQATSVYKSNLGAGNAALTDIAMFDFLNAQTKVNAKAAFPFQSFGFYTNYKSRYLLDAPQGDAPSMAAEYSSSVPDTRSPSLPPLPSETVAAYLQPESSAGIHDIVAGTYAFAAPILINEFEKKADGTRVKHDLLLGMSVVTFDEQVILAPYFETRTIVFILTFLFLYVAVGLVYVVGNFIVNPLLFLRMNVRNASETLESMIRGEIRISPSALQFADTVKTRDEVKTLSGEIGNMVTVIRGIIPYISASTLKQAEKGTSHSERKDLAFLFTDIRGFTTLCEGMNPEEVVAVLNRYLDLETEIILANHGDVDKFVGDEMMAFFDGPDKERNACRAAMQIRKAMYEEKALRLKQGLPAVEIGIGINTGDVVFGSMGARERMDFTSIGDTVNLAARLEGANKAYSSKSIIAESVYLKVQDLFVCRELDFIAVKGKNEPVRIYEILQEKETASSKLQLIATNFGQGLEAYRAQDWPKALAVFENLVTELRDAPAEVFVNRVRHFQKNPPPANWDGVFRMEVK